MGKTQGGRKLVTLKKLKLIKHCISKLFKETNMSLIITVGTSFDLVGNKILGQ